MDKRTPKHQFREEEDVWEEFGRVVGNRSAALRRYIRWQLDHPDLPLPQFPTEPRGP